MKCHHCGYRMTRGNELRVRRLVFLSDCVLAECRRCAILVELPGGLDSLDLRAENVSIRQ